MDILQLICSPPIWVTIPALILISLYLYTKYKQSFFKRLGIPGPKPRPFLGILPEFAKQGTFYTDIELVRKYGKCFGVYIGNAPSLMVSDPAMLQEILVKQFSCFTNRSEIIRSPDTWRLSLITSLDDHWRYMRNIINPTFSSSKLRNMDPIVHRCLNNLINNLEDELETSNVVEMQKFFVALTMDVISGVAFGIDIDAQKDPGNRFARDAYKMMDIQVGRNPLIVLNFIFPELQGVCAKLGLSFTDKSTGEYLHNTLKMAIEERRKNETSEFNDLLNLMLTSHKTEKTAKPDMTSEEMGGKKEKIRGMTDDEVLWNAIMFFMAGHDSTASALTWLAYLLATHQHVQDRLIAEIDKEMSSCSPDYDSVNKLTYLDMVFSETMRLYSPSTRIIRDTAHDTTVCGVKIPKGTDITIPIHGIHRLPEFWPEPEKFDPERFSSENRDKIIPYTYLPFALGPRSCVGMRLARTEVKMAAVVLLQHFRLYPSERLEDPPSVAKGVVVKPEHGIWLKLERRQ